jgi:large subunit ribosomal protein L18
MTRKEIIAKRNLAARRAARTRSKINGSAERPRLSVFRSKQHISVQLIDDTSGRTLGAASDLKSDVKGSPLDRAAAVGKAIAVAAKAKGITTVVFDRGAFMYHGRVKSLAEAARAEGLIF